MSDVFEIKEDDEDKRTGVRHPRRSLESMLEGIEGAVWVGVFILIGIGMLLFVTLLGVLGVI
ncbi:MAG TPA: hypothetical protein VFT98_20230 [Myxococcota bacterium]|nr:hypothetical protein [Myxococcota bacterium]